MTATRRGTPTFRRVLVSSHRHAQPDDNPLPVVDVFWIKEADYPAALDDALRTQTRLARRNPPFCVGLADYAFG